MRKNKLKKYCMNEAFMKIAQKTFAQKEIPTLANG